VVHTPLLTLFSLTTAPTHQSAPFSVCFICLHLFVCISVWAVKMNFKLDAYTKQTWYTYLTTSIQPTGLSFTLFWTLFYGLVYLY
jgi:hypothetical protein